MPNATILAAAEGVPCATRRSLLCGFAAASTTAAIAVAPKAHGADASHPQAFAGEEENPKLLSAYQKFVLACSELREAQDALEWLADEWRHQWPLAPEELLLGANAQDGRYTMPAERDIIGRYLVRDTTELTKRFPAKFRREFRRTCFILRTAQDERERLQTWLQRTPTGRTAKSLEENRAFRLKAMKECELRIQLAEQYEAETTRIRRISGADAAQQRVKDADAQVYKAADEVSRCQARTIAGFKMKADALAITASGLITLTDSDSPLGQIARFVNSVAEFAGRAAV